MMKQAVMAGYRKLLRLYPARFRAEFESEMIGIFEQRLQDAQGDWALAAVILSEVRDLPLSVVRERLHEAHQKEVELALEGLAMRRNFYSPRLFRWCIISLLTLFVLYVCSAVLAYFVFDLRHNDLNRAWEWWYAIGNQPGYIGNNFLVGLVGYGLWLISPVLIVLGGGYLLVMLWRRWSGLSQRLRWLAIAAVVIGCAMFLTMGSPIGYMAALWFYD